MIDISYIAPCEDFKVEFSSGTVQEAAGITEESIGEREALLKKYSQECQQELEKLTSHAAGLDLLASVCCGVAAGLIDAIAVGKWDYAKAKSISNKDVNRAVIEFANKHSDYRTFLGRGRDGESLPIAIQFLEKQYHLPGDGAYRTKGLNISPKDHRLADFCHHTSPVGLICCILVQFSEQTVFFNPAGELLRIPIVVNEYGDFIGDNPSAKIFSGVINWFFTMAKTMANRKGHIMSDSATPQGIPGTFMSLMKELSALPCFKEKDFGEKLRKAYANGIGDSKGQLDLGTFNALFSGASSKVDMRTEIAVGHELRRQSIPVMINEMLVRGVYFVRRFISEMQEKGSIDKISWRNCIPANNRTIQRMVTVASGTFAAIDLADAAIESALSSGGNSAKLAEGMVLRINFVNIGRFTLGCAVDADSGTRKAGYEFMAIELSTGRLAVTAEKSFLKSRMRLEHTKEREKKLAVILGEDLNIDKAIFTVEDAQIAIKDITENKLQRVEEIRKRPWYKKFYSSITFHSKDVKHALENIKDTQEILVLLLQVFGTEISQLNLRMDRIEDAFVKQMQQPVEPVRVTVYEPEKEEKSKLYRPSKISPDINAKYGGQYKIVSAKEPDKAISVFHDKTFMGGLNSMNKSLELVSKHNLNVTIWTVESCGTNIYRIVDSASGLVIEYDPDRDEKTTLYTKKWKEKPCCIWEIKDNKDGTVSIFSNADISMALKQHRSKGVAVGKLLLKEGRWKLERQ